MSGNMSDKCYVYFDKLPPTLANWVIEQYNGTQGNNNIYYRNGTITNDAGANPNNYLCFDTTCIE